MAYKYLSDLARRITTTTSAVESSKPRERHQCIPLVSFTRSIRQRVLIVSRLRGCSSGTSRISVFGMQPHLDYVNVRLRSGFVCDYPDLYPALKAVQFLQFIGSFYDEWH